MLVKLYNVPFTMNYYRVFGTQINEYYVLYYLRVYHYDPVSILTIYMYYIGTYIFRTTKMFIFIKLLKPNILF